MDTDASKACADKVPSCQRSSARVAPSSRCPSARQRRKRACRQAPGGRDAAWPPTLKRLVSS